MPTDVFTAILLGNAPDFSNLLNAARFVASTDATVLILGESGTGKELLAQAMHQYSRRAAHPFVTVNCAAIPENLAESELFGHRKGAFTGATEHQQGRIQAADRGTVFLDEIGELPLSVQAKLLRFLETGECQVVGQSTTTQVNTRLIAATHRDLYADMQTGRFRKDLYYRLNIVPLELPPLRQRIEDIELLLKHFIAHFSTQHQLPAPEFSTATLKLLRQFTWQGNVRELRNFCERMVIFHGGKPLEPTHLPREFHVTVPPATVKFTLPDTGINLQTVEQQFIQQALEKAAGNRSKAARLLGLTRDTLLYRIKKFGGF
jgi:transcriptional regulator with PAS, ATPase and Fis domain